VVDKNYWDQIKDKMVPYFIAEQFEEGITFAIKEAAGVLKNHFPYHKSDVNELSDKIVFGKGSDD